MPLNESGSNTTVQYIVTTTNTADGTLLYWKTTGNTTNSDIVGGNTGTISITNDRAYINVTIVADTNTDGDKTLGISLSTGSQNGPTVISTPNPILVNDTSQSPSTRIWVWGNNGNAQLGTNDTVTRSSPTQIGGLIWKSITIGADNGSLLATKTDNTLWSWGYNGDGQSGQNDTINRSSPVQIGTDTNWSQTLGDYYSAWAIKSNGTLWAWGQNSYGQLGTNNTTSYSSPTQVGTGTNWAAIPWVTKNSAWCHALATKTDGTLWMWGFNTFDELGLGGGDTANRSSPIQVGALTNWPQTRQKMSIGWAYTMIIKTNGTLWGWGANWNPGGNLGLNSTTIYTKSPIQVGALTDWATIACGRQQSIAVKTNGTLWSWGLNDNGQLGQNDRIDRSSPTQVGTDTNWAYAQIGQNFGIAVKTNGTLWAWGKNTEGQLGQNNVTYRSSPVQIGSDATWASSYERLSSSGTSALVIKT
jgi:alpha-tubulin suppressor-like RCC1 family protein